MSAFFHFCLIFPVREKLVSLPRLILEKPKRVYEINLISQAGANAWREVEGITWESAISGMFGQEAYEIAQLASRIAPRTNPANPRKHWISWICQ